ncbi:MAG: DNA-directed RNA polymerase subunit beta' [Dehalococcoidia bacterium]|nr:DNA-directed RNA polymerase subunit beta' [Dehalococcoidia bacterium]
MVQFDELDSIRVSLASPEQIRSWSHGEVTKAETINYRTLKPERDGLFCERIFGPIKDFECHCGKYKKVRYKGVICDKCGVEVAHSSVRRERMGHIELAAPVAHIWFVKLVPSQLALLLNISPRNLESVIYFAQHIIISVNEEAQEERIHQLEEEITQKFSEREDLINSEIEKLQANAKPEEDDEFIVEKVNQLRAELAQTRADFDEELKINKAEIKTIKPLKLLGEEQYQGFKNKYGDIFEAGIGAEAILEILKTFDVKALCQELSEEIHNASGQHRKKLSKRLQLLESLKTSENKPEWMILTVLPVLPPALRPIVQLDGGRFVISDINDLYRRVINRNNRLRRLIELGAPEVIIRNEKRMLQEAVDALIDNGRRGRAVTTGNNHTLKSLSAMLRGKQGRFRQNLLGKRVDYSGRSVIVVGPQLKIHQCGLPRHVALELFKPFVMHKLIEKGYANNVKVARRQLERAMPEVWDLLSEVVKERPVLLNRAPTLHRLSIQAFEPVLIDGNAFQLHPLVCAAFNADFDGDQMAVHIPLSQAAVSEARKYMLSVHNMLLPSCGEPVTAPSLDIVFGCYYLTFIKPGAKGEGKLFSNFEATKLACELDIIDFNAEIEVRDKNNGRKRIKTTVGRILFNEILPLQLRFYNETVDKTALKSLVSDCIHFLGNNATATILDNIKQMGFEYATRSGISIAMNDIEEPPKKAKLLKEADKLIGTTEDQFDRGFITEDERYENAVRIWIETTDKIAKDLSQSLDHYGCIYMMATSGAKGNMSQISQMAGMRGLMTDPSGKIIDFPIRSSFRNGLSPMEYFISTHGARKGLADTALRTSDSGYLTRRLIDIAQDVIVTEQDCGTTEGVWISGGEAGSSLPSLGERIIGYLAASPIVNPDTGEIIVERNEEIDEEKVKQITATDITRVYVRSPLSCHSKFGICQYCYGRDLAKRQLVNLGVAAGIVAAQSIGEPGTQLTLRTFHTGGVVGTDITSGLPRVEELFEARTPKGCAIISDIGGTVDVVDEEGVNVVKINSSESYQDEYELPSEMEMAVTDGQSVDVGTILFSPTPPSQESKDQLPAITEQEPITARTMGQVIIENKHLYIKYTEEEKREYVIPQGARLRVKTGDVIKAGSQLTDGVIAPQDILRVLGKEAVQQYLIDEVQKVYRSQGVTIHEKHIAAIVRQMLRKVRIISSGDTNLLPDQLVDHSDYEEANARVLAEGGEPATAQTVLLGITKASLNKDSWLAAASFQETSRVLVDAAIKGKIDKLRGLKENVILGKLIPTRAPIPKETKPTTLQLKV